MLLLKGFFVVACLIQLSHCFSDGAGIEACTTMVPLHDSTPQTSPPPYTITPSATSVGQGQTLTVTIARTSAAVFLRGFMIQARNPAGAPVGSFFLTTGMRTMACAGFPPASVATHSDASARESIAIVWTAPTNFVGPVVFASTVLNNYSTYWTGLNSGTVNVTG